MRASARSVSAFRPTRPVRSIDGVALPEHAIEFKFSDKLAPRVGVAYDINGDGTLEGVRFVGRVL